MRSNNGWRAIWNISNPGRSGSISPSFCKPCRWSSRRPMPGDQEKAETIRPIVGRRPPIDAYDADIIILSLNRLAETIEAVQSALAQRGISFHVTVLDQ